MRQDFKPGHHARTWAGKIAACINRINAAGARGRKLVPSWRQTNASQFGGSVLKVVAARHHHNNFWSGFEDRLRRSGADAAKILCDDQLRLDLLQFLNVKPMQALSSLYSLVDLAINFRGIQARLEARVHNHRFAAYLRRVVALVRNPANGVLQSKGAQDFRRRRQERADAHNDLQVLFVCQNQIGKDKSIARDNLAHPDWQGVLKHRARIDKGVKFSVFPAGVRGRRQVCKQLLVELPARELRTEGLAIDAR